MPICTHFVKSAIACGSELRLWRHLDRTAMADRFDQRTLFGMARHDNRASIASAKQYSRENRAADPIPASRPVTLETMLCENRPDLRLEKFSLAIRGSSICLASRLKASGLIR